VHPRWSSRGVSTGSTNAWGRPRDTVTTRPGLRFAHPRWSSLSRPGDRVYGSLPRSSHVVSGGLDRLDQRVGATRTRGHDATRAAVRAPTPGRLAGSRQARPTRGRGLETRPRRDPDCGSRTHAGRACRDPVTMSTEACSGIRKSSRGVSTGSTNAWARPRDTATTRPGLRFVHPRWSSLSRPGDHVYGSLPRYPQVVSRGLDRLDQRVGATRTRGHDATRAAVRAPTPGRLAGSRQARPTRGRGLETRPRRDPDCGSRTHAGRACRDPVTMSTEACSGIRRSSRGVSTGSTNAWVRPRDEVTTRPGLRFVPPRWVVSRGLDRLDQRVGAASRRGHDATRTAVRAPTLVEPVETR